MSMRFLIAMSIVIGMVGAASAAPAYATDFETDQSANFVVVQPFADASAEFQYDYSTFAPTGTNTIVIQPAPSGAGSAGLRLSANATTDANLDSINVQTITGFGGDITVTADVFMMHNGGAGGGSGSTQFGGFGFGADGVAAVGTGGGVGIAWGATGDGGSSTDYRVYDNSVVANSVGSWWGVAANNQTAVEWTTFYPNNADLGGGDLTGQVTAGAMGKKWVVVTMVREDASGEVNVSFNGTEVNSFVPVNNGIGAAFFLHSDINATASAASGDENFTVFDNVSITASTTPVELSVFLSN